jgi:hypothetical protein
MEKKFGWRLALQVRSGLRQETPGRVICSMVFVDKELHLPFGAARGIS